MVSFIVRRFSERLERREQRFGVRSVDSLVTRSWCWKSGGVSGRIAKRPALSDLPLPRFMDVPRSPDPADAGFDTHD
ncbi:MAG: hypothetical protein ACK58T_10065, partial [Phycisphaerae bacterium]